MASPQIQQHHPTLTARVVGFSAGSPTTYTTEVALAASPAATYTLALRYSTLHAAYTKLVEVDSTFAFDFPKKGGLFSSPSPEERQPQLDAFLQAVVAHLATSAVAEKLRAVVEELLEVEAHRVPEEEKVAAVTEEVTEEVVVEQVAVEVEETSPKKSNDVASDTECSDDNVEEEEPQTAEPVAEPLVQVVEEEEADSCCCCDSEKTEAVAEEKKQEEHPAPVVEEIKEQEAVVEEIKAEPVVETAAEEIVAETMPTVEQPKHKLAADPLRVVATTTSVSAAGEKVQHITFANGMSLKKKSLSADQKKLRNMRRKEKRKKKASMKVRGVKASAGGASSSEDDGDY